MLKKLLLTALILSSSTVCFAEDIEIKNNSFSVNSKEYEFTNKPYRVGNSIFIDAEEFFEKIGFHTVREKAFDGISVFGNNMQSVILSDKTEHVVNYGLYRYKRSARFSNGRLYIDTDLIEDITGTDTAVKEEIPHEEYYIGDDFRIEGDDIKYCKNCYVLNNSYMFSPVTIHDRNAISYASAVNKIAELLPDANVYNMLVLDSNEIYGPKSFYTGQKRSVEMIYSNLSDKVTPVRVDEKLLKHADEKIYYSTDHHWTHRGAFYAWQTFLEAKGLEPLKLESFEKADTDSFVGSYVQRMPADMRPDNLNVKETMERFLPEFETSVTIYSDAEMTKKMGKIPLINLKNNTYSCFISGDHPVALIESSVGNGKKLAIIKESFGNALSTWAVNNYQYVYVLDVRGFKGGKLHISDFYEKTKFDDLIIESYPTTVESKELRGYLTEMAE